MVVTDRNGGLFPTPHAGKKVMAKSDLTLPWQEERFKSETNKKDGLKLQCIRYTAIPPPPVYSQLYILAPAVQNHTTLSYAQISLKQQTATLSQNGNAHLQPRAFRCPAR